VSEYRVLLMDSLSMTPPEVMAASDAIRNGLKTAAPHIHVVVVLGTEERDRSFADQGSWDSWCTHVATGINFEMRTPLFNAIAIMSESMGKATASIMEQALDARRMGLLVRGGQLKQVQRVEVVDAEDWKAGWKAIVA